MVQRRFITYPKYNISFIKIIIYIILFLIGLIITIKILFNKYNDSYNDKLLSIGTNNLIGNISLLDIASFNLKKPESLLSMSFNNVGSIDIPVTKKVIKEEKVIKKNIDPIIYIYNTHQTEEYNAGNLREYNITPTVYMAANILKKKMDNLGIPTIVEDENIVDVLKKNNWKYSESYNASWQWLNNAKEKHPSLKYFIDLHRDSSSGTKVINDLKYAKMMFVVGMNHENYEKNESLVIKLNNYLNENYEGLMRNIFYGKRSQYNQHFNENTILIEVGGPENTIEEVSNSINALSDALYYVIGESNGN